MKWEYAIVLALVLFFPLVLSGDRKLPLRKNTAGLVKTLFIVCLPYWLLDCAMTARGHWGFNEMYTIGLTLLGIPLEEWLFFPIIVFVSVFTWESTQYFLGERG